MAQVRMIPNAGHIKFADTQVAITTAPDMICQVTACSVDPTLAYSTTPATGCSGETQALKVPVPWVLNMTFLQDWNATTADGLAGGLANYAKINAGQVKYFEYTPTASATLKVAGQVEVAPVGFAGEMGVVSIAGPVAWQVQGQPTFTVPTTLEMQEAGAELDTDAEAVA